MKIPLCNAVNCRDIGGIATKFGVIETHRLIRCGKLDRIDSDDIYTLQQLPLKRVIDLRTNAEIANCPDVLIDGVQAKHIPIISATTFGISYETSDGKTIADKLQAGIVRMQSRGETPLKHMEILYASFVSDKFCRNGYGSFLKALANEPTNGATLWHCSQGKDRVGTCTALLLHCLGASKDSIFADYMLTNEQMQENINGIVNKISPFVSEERLQLVLSMLYVNEKFLQTFFDKIDEFFGNTDSFLNACGITPTDIEKLRTNYIV